MVFTLTLRPLLTSSFAAAVLTAAIRHRRAANVNTGRDNLLSFPPHTFVFLMRTGRVYLFISQRSFIDFSLREEFNSGLKGTGYINRDPLLICSGRGFTLDRFEKL